MCEYCDAKIYVAKRKIMKDFMQPLTPEGILRQQLEDITGLGDLFNTKEDTLYDLITTGIVEKVEEE